MYKLYKEADLGADDRYPYIIRDGDSYVWASTEEMREVSKLKYELRIGPQPWTEQGQDINYLAEDESFENLCATALMWEMLDD